MNLLIVDDEAIYRNGMVDILRRHRPDVAVFAAANGAEALRVLEAEAIDGVFLDIRMPKCTGFELLDAMKERGMDGVVVVIVSGVNDFEYARSAIRGNVFEYLLKPITPGEALEMLSKIESEIAARRRRQEELSSLRKIVAQNMGEMQLQLFQDVLSGMYDKDDLLQRGDFLDVYLRGEEFLCAALEIQSRALPPSQPDTFYERQACILKVQELLHRVLSKYPMARAFHFRSDLFALFFCAKTAGELQTGRIIADLDEFIAAACEEHGIMLTAGIGETCRAVEQIAVCYAEAVRALRYKTIFESCDTYSIQDFRRKGRGYTIGDSDQFGIQIRNGDLEALKDSVRKTLVSAAGDEEEADLSALMLACNEILLILCKILHENNIDTSRFFRPGNLGLMIPDNLRKLEDIYAWLEGLLKNVVELMSTRDITEHSRLVYMVKGYVECNYAKPLSNAIVAEAFGYSPNYMGRVFRNETGIGLNEYIKDVRLERAKALLQNTSMHILEIATQTGFSDNQYFSVVFRQKQGCTPKEYREMVQSGRS